MSEHTDTRARSDSAEVAFRKIFIGGLSFSTDEDKLRKYFKQYGNVQEAVVMKDPATKRSRGFGFVTFHDVSSVDSALADEPHTIDGRKVEAKRAVPRSEINKEGGGQSQRSAPATQSAQTQKPAAASNSNTSGAAKAAAPAPTAAKPAAAAASAGHHAEGGKPSGGGDGGKINLDDYAFNKIFVGGLHYDTRDAEFKAYFEKYGRVISAEVMFNRETHKSRGFGFIVFETENSAIQVCQVKEHSIDGKVVEVKRAIPRSKLTPGTPTSHITPSMYASATTKPTPAAVKPTTQPAAASTAAAPKAAGTKPADGAAEGAPAAAAAPAKAVVNTSRTAVATTSYAAALKAGTAHEHGSAAAPGSIGGVAPHLSSAGQTLMYGSLQQAVQRPARSYSEPIVKFFEGSSALNGEPIDEALLLARNSSAGAITKTPSSNASSRSNSIVQGPHFLGQGFSPDTGAPAANSTGTPTLSNIKWLSSPPSNPLDPSGSEFGLQLPPATEQKAADATAAQAQQAAPAAAVNPYAGHHQHGMINSSGLWLPPGQQGAGNLAQQQQPALHAQQQAFQQAAMQQQFMQAPFGGMMFMPMAGANPYMGMQAPPGVAPSPDVWAAMVSNHQAHEQMGMPHGQFPGQQFMMSPYPFFSPDGSGMGFPPGTTPQQQMMFFNAQQQMQAFQHMQFQQMAAAQAQMQARAQGAVAGQNAGQNSSTSVAGSTASAASGGAEQQKSTDGQQAAARPQGAPGLSAPAHAAPAVNRRPNEHTESDDFFGIRELNLDSPAFDPKATAWIPPGRR